MSKQLLSKFKNIIRDLYSREYYFILLGKLDNGELTTDEKRDIWLITLSTIDNKKFVFYNKQHIELMFNVTKIVDTDMYSKVLECLVLKLRKIMDKNELLNIMDNIYLLEHTIIEKLSEASIKECFSNNLHIYVNKYYRL